MFKERAFISAVAVKQVFLVHIYSVQPLTGPVDVFCSVVYRLYLLSQLKNTGKKCPSLFSFLLLSSLTISITLFFSSPLSNSPSLFSSPLLFHHVYLSFRLVLLCYSNHPQKGIFYHCLSLFSSSLLLSHSISLVFPLCPPFFSSLNFSLFLFSSPLFFTFPLSLYRLFSLRSSFGLIHQRTSRSITVATGDIGAAAHCLLAIP